MKVLRDSLKRVKWDPSVVPRKTESVRFGRDSAKQANPARANQSHVTGGRTSSVRRQYDKKIQKIFS